MSDKLFRINLFGGYKKEDVQAYVASLEAELTRMQEQMSSGSAALHDKVQEEASKVEAVGEAVSKAGTLEEGASGAEVLQEASKTGTAGEEVPMAGKEMTIGEDVVIFQDVAEEVIKAEEAALHTGTGEPQEGTSGESVGEKEEEKAEQQRVLEEARSELEQVKRELQDTRAELEISSRLCEQSKLRLELALTEKERLTDEVEKFRENQKNYERDYAAVKDVLLNARLDAEIILTKARKEAKELLEHTQKQIEEQKKESVETLMRHLVENHTGLQASKYYLEEQVKSIERTEKQIEALQTKMENFLEPDFDGEEHFVKE